MKWMERKEWSIHQATQLLEALEQEVSPVASETWNLFQSVTDDDEEAKKMMGKTWRRKLLKYDINAHVPPSKDKVGTCCLERSKYNYHGNLRYNINFLMLGYNCII